jgi:hypothetical protein
VRGCIHHLVDGFLNGFHADRFGDESIHPRRKTSFPVAAHVKRLVDGCPAIRKLARNASALSEARFHESVKLGEVLCARSIEPFEGGRWRLR